MLLGILEKTRIVKKEKKIIFFSIERLLIERKSKELYARAYVVATFPGAGDLASTKSVALKANEQKSTRTRKCIAARSLIVARKYTRARENDPLLTRRVGNPFDMTFLTNLREFNFERELKRQCIRMEMKKKSFFFKLANADGSLLTSFFFSLPDDSLSIGRYLQGRRGYDLHRKVSTSIKRQE